MAALMVVIVQLSLFDRWERDIYDIFCRMGTEEDKQHDIIQVIAIDQYTLDWGNSHFEAYASDEDMSPHIVIWQWDRAVYDIIIQFLTQGGATVFALDMDFSSPYPSGDASGDESLAISTMFANVEGGGKPYVIHTLNLLETADERKAAIDLSEEKRRYLEGSAIAVEGAEESGLPFDRSDQGTYYDQILPYDTILEHFAGQESLLRLGAVIAQPDSDSEIRRARPFATYRGRHYPSLGLAAVLAHIESEDGPGSCKVAVEDDELVVVRTRSGVEQRVPLTPSGDILIRWGDTGRESPDPDEDYFRTIPAHRILRSFLASQGKLVDLDATKEKVLEPADFKGKIVFLGTTTPGLHDLKATPISENYPGVKVHAAVAEALLEGRAIKRLGAGWRSVLAAMAGLLALAATLLVRSIPLKIAASLILAVLLILAAGLLFLQASLWIDVVAPLAGVAVAFSGGTTYNYFTEGRRSREVTQMFQHFAPPQVVKRLVANPSEIHMRGEIVEITSFFSDIRSFTSISNTPEMRQDPAKLTDHLNNYLTEMTRAITDCGGTVDKYIGDAVVAIFGAPLPLENHAREACRAALECQKRLDEFNVRAGEKGLPAFVTRIGLFSGTATVGCVGSRERYSYTAIGSTVNFASRLEGVNKAYGTLIMAGGPLVDQAEGSIRFRRLDVVRVPGLEEKAPPLEIHEVLTALDDDDPLPPDLRTLFEEARQLYNEAKFGEAAERFDFLFDKYEDRPSRALAKRCRIFSESPPEDGWNGVYRIISK